MNNEKQQSMTFNGTWKPTSDQQNADRNHRQKPTQEPELMCACTGTLCEGICRTTHLHRPRYAMPVKSKSKDQNSAIRQSWTNPPNQCPESYVL